MQAAIIAARLSLTQYSMATDNRCPVDLPVAVYANV